MRTLPLPYNDTIHEEILPGIESKLPLVQLEGIVIFCHLKKEADSHLSATFFHVVVEGDEVSPQPSFCPIVQSQFPRNSCGCSIPGRPKTD